MLTTVPRTRAGAALATTLAVAGLALAAGPLQAAGATATAAGGSSIDLRGGDATAWRVCGNVADALAFTDANHFAVQQNDCHPEAPAATRAARRADRHPPG